MERIERSISIRAPIRAVYNQWTQFEEFPDFMEGIREVAQQSERALFWRAEIGGKEVTWLAEIYEQIPDVRIAWKSVTGAPQAGAVSFRSLGPEQTQIDLAIDYVPLGAVEKVGDALGLVGARVEGDLQRFKSFIEDRQVATGAWRGTIR